MKTADIEQNTLFVFSHLFRETTDLHFEQIKKDDLIPAFLSSLILYIFLVPTTQIFSDFSNFDMIH